MSYSIISRLITEDERQWLSRQARLSKGDWLWIFIPIPGVAVIFFWLGVLSMWVVGLFGWYSEFPFRVVFAIAGAVIGIPCSFGMYRLLSGVAQQINADMKSGKVDVLTVTDASVVVQEAWNDEGPIYYFGIGNEKILLLWGQWMYDPVVVPKMCVEIDNFPSSSFVVHRTHEYGKVICLDIKGEPIKPVRTLRSRSVGLFPLGESVLFDGKLEDVVELVKQEKRQRKGKSGRLAN